MESYKIGLLGKWETDQSSLEDKQISEAFFFLTVEYISNLQKSLSGKRGLMGFSFSFSHF